MVERDPFRVPAAITRLIVVVSLGAAAGCGGPPRPPERPTFERVAVNQRGVGIPYGAVVLFKIDQELVALRVVEAPLWGYAIEYEWNAAPLSADVFETTSTGAGQTDEKQQRGAVRAGTLYMQWSRGSKHFGWLYWPEEPKNVSVSSITFRSVDSINLKDPEIFWYTQDMFE
jgi:hypothetical protein